MTIMNLIEDAFSKKDFEEVIELCDEIPKNRNAMAYKASSLRLMDRPQEALDVLDMADYPNNPDYHYIRAEALMDMEQYESAIESFERIFELEVSDETSLTFMKMNYNACLALRCDELIEMEKYVDAWKVNLKSQSPYSIEGFTRYVRQYSSRAKSRKYHVGISSRGAKVKLFEFLKENGFEISDGDGLKFLIDVVAKTCIKDDDGEITISESKFYDKVNYYPRDKIESKRIFFESGKLAYGGYALKGAPYGFGKAYFEDGTLYREGIFDLKGIAQGREYYPSGRLRFEGEWSLTRGYGPNAPFNGNAYDEGGNLIFSGQFEIKRGGVGWPMIQKPKGFALMQKERPKIEYFNGVIG
ncbi:CDC27 family protein [uncultured Methanobrevibacter sp.]|uniref:CDC27 family protein n=1 Tax=uncultured Methanobrevibacter sp. TaxID=253161 RepID=UPI0025CE90B9|nr:CDC27 family protein [uncultured Methanobrevibacter sp.]